MGKIKTAVKRRYTEEDLQNALEQISTGRSYKAVSEQFGIPRSTLFNKNKGISRPTIVRKGPSSVLGDDTEARLVQWILHMGERGMPVTKTQLLDSVQLLVKVKKITTVFTNDRPGRGWYRSFRDRHCELCERLSQNMLPTRSSITEERIRGWFRQTKVYLESKNLLDLHPSRIFNCDESAFRLCPQGNSVLAKRGERSVYNFVQNDEKECLTTLFCGNAAGQIVDPMVMFSYTRIPSNVSKLMPPRWGIGRSESGWMTGISFYEWTANIFYPWLIRHKIQFPVILYLDGHVSHLTLQLSDFCREKEIEIIALYPNATDILQPMDVGIFHPLKAIWKKVVPEWRMEHNGERIRKDQFGIILKRAVDSMKWETILPDAFKATGLYPFTPEGINFGKHLKTSGCQKTEIVDEAPKNVNTFSLESFERNIKKDLLHEFRLTADDEEWTGALCHQSLFDVWRNIKSQNSPGCSTASESTDSKSKQTPAECIYPQEVSPFISNAQETAKIARAIKKEKKTEKAKQKSLTGLVKRGRKRKALEEIVKKQGPIISKEIKKKKSEHSEVGRKSTSPPQVQRLSKKSE